MNPSRLFVSLGLAATSLGFCGCGLPFIAVEYAAHGVKETARNAAPDPESKWNRYGWWKRVSDDPATYIPKSSAASASRSKAAGTWFVDARDGKRLFVPTGDEVLTADARVVTTTNAGDKHTRFEGQSTGENLLNLFPPIMGP